MYRLVIAACFSFSTTTLEAYILLEICLAVMFFFHSLFQPYKKEHHNILEGFVLADLVVINGITIFNHASASYTNENVLFSVAFQLVLIYTTIAVMIFVLLLKVRSYRYYNVNIDK